MLFRSATATGESLADALIATGSLDSAKVIVVTGNRSEAVRRSLGDGARYCVFNQQWGQGRATSLARGARALIERGRTASSGLRVVGRG